MLRNLTMGRYLYFQTYKSQSISEYLFPRKFLSEMMIQKNLKDLERMEVLITSHMKVFLGNKYNIYIHTARNAKVTSTGIIYEKSVMKRRVFRGVLRTHWNMYDEAFLRK